MKYTMSYIPGIFVVYGPWKSQSGMSVEGKSCRYYASKKDNGRYEQHCKNFPSVLEKGRMPISDKTKVTIQTVRTPILKRVVIRTAPSFFTEVVVRVSRAVFRYRMMTAVRRQAKVSKTETIVLSMISAKSIESIEKRESDSVFARRGKKDSVPALVWQALH